MSSEAESTSALIERVRAFEADKLEADIMTPRDQRTDPIYNRCLICGQAGHCSASCPKGRGNRRNNRRLKAVRLIDGLAVRPMNARFLRTET